MDFMTLVPKTFNKKWFHGLLEGKSLQIDIMSLVPKTFNKKLIYELSSKEIHQKSMLERYSCGFMISVQKKFNMKWIYGLSSKKNALEINFMTLVPNTFITNGFYDVSSKDIQ